MHIPNRESFLPSKPTLRRWLATRKPHYNISGAQFPGFFSDTGNGQDTLWFISAILGETACLGLTLYGGASSGGEYFIAALIFVVLFIICDIFFALKLHRNHAKHTETRSLMLLANSQVDTARLEHELKRGRFTDLMLQLGMFLMAVLKLFALLLVSALGSNIIVYIPVLVIFTAVAYIHIYHTGYFLAYIFAEKAMQSDYKLFAAGKCLAETNKYTFKINGELEGLPLYSSQHKIVAGENGLYEMCVKGIVTDEDVTGFIGGQHPAMKILLFKALREFQLTQI